MADREIVFSLPVEMINTHRGQGWACARSDDGTLLATGSESGRVCIVDIERATSGLDTTPIFDFIHEGRLYEQDRPRERMVTSIAWLPGSSSLFVAATRDCSLICVRRTESGGWSHVIRRKLPEIVKKKVVSLDEIKAASFERCAFSPTDPTLLVVSTSLNFLLLFRLNVDKNDFEMAARLEGPDQPRGVCFSPDGSMIASGDRNLTVHVFTRQANGDWVNTTTLRHPRFGHNEAPTSTSQPTASGSDMTRDEQKTRQFFCVRFSPDGSILAAGTARGHIESVILWKVVPGQARDWPFMWFNAHTSYAVFDLIFIEGGKYLVTCSPDHTVRVWAPPKGLITWNNLSQQALPDDKANGKAPLLCLKPPLDLGQYAFTLAYHEKTGVLAIIADRGTYIWKIIRLDVRGQ